MHSGTSDNILVEGKEGFHQSHSSMHKHVLRDKGELADYNVLKTKQTTLLALWENQRSFLLPSKLGIEEDTGIVKRGKKMTTGPRQGNLSMAFSNKQTKVQSKTKP